MPKKKEVTSPEVLSILRDCTEEQLSYMSALASKPDFANFVAIARKLIDKKKDIVFGYPENDAQKLAIFKSNFRGQVDGILNLLHVIKGVGIEMDRRKKKKK